MMARIFKIFTLFSIAFWCMLFFIDDAAHAARNFDGNELAVDIIENYAKAAEASLDGKAKYVIGSYARDVQKKKWIKDMKIRSIIYNFKFYDEGKVSRGGKIIETFDGSGNRLELSTFCLSGALQMREIYKYDSAGRLTSVDEYSECNYDCFNTRIEYDLNGIKKKTANFYAGSGKLFITELETYDFRGNLTQTIRREGAIENIETYKYDLKGRKTGETSGEHTITFKYDDNDNLVESTDKSRDECSTKTYKYDAGNNPLEETEHSSNGKILNKKYIKYHADGQLLEEVEYDRDTLARLTLYDTDGRKIILISYGSDGKVFVKTFYRYDSHGGRISETEFCDRGILFTGRSEKITRKYNEKGFEIESVRRNIPGELGYTSTVSYEIYNK